MEDYRKGGGVFSDVTQKNPALAKNGQERGTRVALCVGRATRHPN